MISSLVGALRRQLSLAPDAQLSEGDEHSTESEAGGVHDSLEDALAVRPTRPLPPDPHAPWRAALENLLLSSAERPRPLVAFARRGFPNAARAWAWCRILRANEVPRHMRSVGRGLARIYGTAVPAHVAEPSFGSPLDVSRACGTTHRADAVQRVLCVFAEAHPQLEYAPLVPAVAVVLAKHLSASPDDILACLVAMVDGHGLRANRHADWAYFPLHRRDYAVFERVFEDLVDEFVPRVARHAATLRAAEPGYAPRWDRVLSSLFLGVLPRELVLRIFDCYVTEGYKVVLRFALAHLTLRQDALLAASTGARFDRALVAPVRTARRGGTPTGVLGVLASLPLWPFRGGHASALSHGGPAQGSTERLRDARAPRASFSNVEGERKLPCAPDSLPEDGWVLVDSTRGPRGDPSTEARSLEPRIDPRRDFVPFSNADSCEKDTGAHTSESGEHAIRSVPSAPPCVSDAVRGDPGAIQGGPIVRPSRSGTPHSGSNASHERSDTAHDGMPTDDSHSASSTAELVELYFTTALSIKFERAAVARMRTRHRGQSLGDTDERAPGFQRPMPTLRRGSASGVLRAADWAAFWAWVPPRFRLLGLELAYSSALHGRHLATLLQRCDGLEPLLLIVETDASRVVGAYVSRALDLSNGPAFYGTGESFLFSLRPASAVRYPWQPGPAGNASFVCVTENFLAVGAGGGGFGLWLDRSLLQVASARCATFGNEPLVASSPDAERRVHLVEVYRFC